MRSGRRSPVGTVIASMFEAAQVPAPEHLNSLETCDDREAAA